MLTITDDVILGPEEITLQAIRAQGAGGQNVNKVATAIHLRFAIHGSSLPEPVQQRLLATRDQRITADGVVVIKAQRHRTQEQNRDDALARLRELVLSVWSAPKRRRATKPTRASQQRRLDGKTRRSRVKQTRGRVQD